MTNYSSSKTNKINNQEIYEQKIYASRRLFIAGNNEFSSKDVKNNGGLFAGLNDQITTNSHPETTFYNIMDATPTGYQNFKDWKSWISSSIGILPDAGVKKDFKGVLKFDNTKALKSNSEKIINYFRSNNFRFYYKFKCDRMQKQ